MAPWLENLDICFVFFNISRCWALLIKRGPEVLGALHPKTLKSTLTGLNLYLKLVKSVHTWPCWNTGWSVCTFVVNSPWCDASLTSGVQTNDVLKVYKSCFRGEDFFFLWFYCYFYFFKTAFMNSNYVNLGCD